MKKILIALFMALTLVTVGCTSQTQYGQCIGAFEDRNPKLVYDLNEWNVIMAVVFFEMVFPPIIVILSETHCPIGAKTP